MQEANELRDLLISEFTENYMEKLFYFCLKKTGRNEDAEDLTQDIALQIITALNKGTIPTSYSAWVWQIARNRYSVWAKAKHDRNESVTGDRIDDHEIEDESENILDEMIHTEQLSLLRRELAFIKSDYRNIVVAYYIENKSVRDIASSLSLPTNTVKSRLFRAREILKEGVDMAREFGIRSYKPEEVYLSCSCSSFGKNGQPWTILNHKMYKNIFLEAYGNPSTAEELSMALGVALPYMEDELDYLTKQTFLFKDGNRYETAFPIISKNAQEKEWNYNRLIIDKITKLFTKLIDDFTKACGSHGISYYGKYQSYEDAKWTLLMRAFDIIVRSVFPDSYLSVEFTKRPDGGHWDIMGYQEADIPHLPWVGLHGCLNASEVFFEQFKFKHNGICNKTPEYLTRDEALTLKAVAEGKYEECNEDLLEKLLTYGYIKKTETGYEPAIVVFDGRTDEDYLSCFTSEERSQISNTVSEIREMLRKAIDFSRDVRSQDLPPAIASKEDLLIFACRENAFQRCYVLEQALKDGWIKYDNETSKVIGAYMYL